MHGDRLVQDLMDGARQANARIETGNLNPGVLFKTAGAEAALDALGLSDMEKHAIWGAIVRPALSAAWKHTGGRLIGATAKPMQWAGGKATEAIGKRFGPEWAARAASIGRGAGRDAASFGLLSGGLSAATAEPGDRLSAFGRGFAGGALGGAAWRMGGAGAKRLLYKGLGRQRYMNLARAGRPGWFGGFRGPGGSVSGGLKSFGAKAAVGGVGLGGALGASMMMPTFESSQQAQQRPQGMPYTPGQMYGTGRMMYSGY